MKNKFLPILIVLQIFFLINLSGQIKSKVWYDGNARVMYDRDMLLGSDLDCVFTDVLQCEPASPQTLYDL